MGPKIDYTEITKLIDLLEEHNLSEFELEIKDFKIKMAKNPLHQSVIPSVAVPSPTAESPAVSTPDAQSTQREDSNDLHYITSPMVGTFYRSPDPSSPPFVEVGDQVEKSQTLCIIEAMKLMNEIESDAEGVIEEIYTENGNPIEYGQRLFAIKPV